MARDTTEEQAPTTELDVLAAQMEAQLVAMSLSDRRERSVLVSRGNGIFSVERESVGSLRLGRVGRSR